MTVILPRGVRFLRFQKLIFVLMLDSFSEKFKFNILSKPMSKVIPNNLNLFTPQFNFHFVFIASVLYFLNLSKQHVFSRSLLLCSPEIFA